MHDDKPGVLISLRGHTLLVDEFHSAVIGAAIGLVAGDNSSLSQTLRNEPWYALGLFAIAYTLAKYWSS